MSSVNYIACLMKLVPDAKISYTGVEIDYDDISWEDNRNQPSREDCDLIWPELEIELHNNFSRKMRSQDYSKESDSIFFKWKRGEATEQDWLDSIELVKQRYPYL